MAKSSLLHFFKLQDSWEGAERSNEDSNEDVSLREGWEEQIVKAKPSKAKESHEEF